jgi:hypothetical protein
VFEKLKAVSLLRGHGFVLPEGNDPRVNAVRDFQLSGALGLALDRRPSRRVEAGAVHQLVQRQLRKCAAAIEAGEPDGAIHGALGALSGHGGKDCLRSGHDCRRVLVDVCEGSLQV